MLLAIMAFPAVALPGTFAIDQVYSSADGSVQFVVVIDHGATDCDAGENHWKGLSMISTGPEPARNFVFPADLPTCHTSGRRVLIGTEGFAALGLVTPDFVIPNDFLQHPKGAVSVADVAFLAYQALPDDGANALDGNGGVVPSKATNLAGASASVTVIPPTAFDMNQHGLTGSWYEPATSGQGVEVEIFPDLNGPGKGYTQVSWFTYDTMAGGADRQRWYTLSGDVVSGQPAAALTIYLNTGGNFDAGPVTAAQTIGSATLRFDSCTSGQLDYSFSDGSGRNGSIALTRLTQNMTCVESGSPPTHADFALSGNWYDPATSGQGITVEVNPASKVLFFAWYTYANNGAALGAAGQRWYTGQAGYSPGARSIALTLYETTGGMFDAPTNPAPATVAVGTGTLAFQSCTSATLAFNYTGGSSSGKSGSINLVRIGPTPAGCAPPAAQAKGLWRGTTASGRTISALVLEDGTYYVTYTAPGSITVDGALYGSSTSSGGQFASTTGRLVELRSAFVTSPAVSGTYVAHSSLDLTFGTAPNVEAATLQYDTTYDFPAQIAAIAGSYRGYSGHRQDFYSMTATIDAAGKLTTKGSPGSCNPFGPATPRGQIGVFDITLTSDCFPATPGLLIYEPALNRVSALVPLHDDDMVFVSGTRQ